MLGDRLRELRQRHGLTLRELAARAEVSPGLLSQLENGVTDPSLSTLRKLAVVFDAEMASLFSEPNAPLVHLSRSGERTTLSAPKGQITYERLTPGRGDLEVLRGELQPGDVSAAEPRGHESTECLMVVKGQIVAEVGAQEFKVHAGDALTFDSRLAHRFRNDSSKVAVILLAVTPPNP